LLRLWLGANTALALQNPVDNFGNHRNDRPGRYESSGAGVPGLGLGATDRDARSPVGEFPNGITRQTHGNGDVDAEIPQQSSRLLDVRSEHRTKTAGAKSCREFRLIAGTNYQNRPYGGHEGATGTIADLGDF
jgi:hypothetical protein